jgi:hypothetical protein
MLVFLGGLLAVCWRPATGCEQRSNSCELHTLQCTRGFVNLGVSARTKVNQRSSFDGFLMQKRGTFLAHFLINSAQLHNTAFGKSFQ